MGTGYIIVRARLGWHRAVVFRSTDKSSDVRTAMSGRESLLKSPMVMDWIRSAIWTSLLRNPQSSAREHAAMHGNRRCRMQ